MGLSADLFVIRRAEIQIILGNAGADHGAAADTAEVGHGHDPADADGDIRAIEVFILGGEVELDDIAYGEGQVIELRSSAAKGVTIA